MLQMKKKPTGLPNIFGEVRLKHFGAFPGPTFWPLHFRDDEPRRPGFDLMISNWEVIFASLARNQKTKLCVGEPVKWLFPSFPVLIFRRNWPQITRGKVGPEGGYKDWSFSGLIGSFFGWNHFYQFDKRGTIAINVFQIFRQRRLKPRLRWGKQFPPL